MTYPESIAIRLVCVKKPKPGSWEPITIGGSYVGRITQPNALPPYHIRVSLITNQYRTHACSFHEDKFVDHLICLKITRWLLEHVMPAGTEVKEVRAWDGWKSPWIPGEPVATGTYDVVLESDPKITYRLTAAQIRKRNPANRILAHAHVERPASPFVNLDFT